MKMFEGMNARMLMRRAVMGIAMLVIALDLALDYLRHQIPEFGLGQQIILAGALAVLAVAVLGKRTLFVYASFSLLFTSVLLLCVVADGAFVLLEHASEAASAPYLQSQPWGAQLQHDQAESGRHLRYEPYTVERHAPFSSQTVNIDANGIRRTPGASCSANAIHLLAFGGSTMWGTDSPDSGTVAAFLQRTLAAHTSRPLCVINYGEWSWVSTQELTQLIRHVSEGRQVDALLFYDGVNDPWSAMEAGGVVGAHLSLATYRERLGGGKWRTIGRMLISDLRDGIRSAVVTVRARGQAPAHTYDSLAAPIVARMENNYRLVSDIARQRQLPVAFFLQPILFVGAKPMSPDEMDECETSALDGRQLYHDAYRLARQRGASLAEWHDLSGIFDGDSSLVFVDGVHLTMSANERVAQAMTSWLLRDPAWAGLFPGAGTIKEPVAPADFAAEPRSCEFRTTRGR